MKSLLRAFIAFLGPASGSVRGSVNLAELKRAALGALGGSSALGLAVAVLMALAADSPAIFPGASAAGLASYLFLFVADQLRRLDHVAPAGPAESGHAPG